MVGRAIKESLLDQNVLLGVDVRDSGVTDMEKIRKCSYIDAEGTYLDSER